MSVDVCLFVGDWSLRAELSGSRRRVRIFRLLEERRQGKVICP